MLPPVQSLNKKMKISGIQATEAFLFLTFPFLLLCLSSVQSEAQSKDTIDLKELTITSSRMSLTEEEFGRQLDIIPSREYFSIIAQSLDESLQYIPGIEVQNRGYFGIQGDIMIRASTFNQVLVLVDGMRINDPLTGHFNSSIPITRSAIKRVEILRGAGCSIYGTEAVGGVVNFITDTFDDQRDDPIGRKVSVAGVGFGSNQLFSAFTRLRHSTQKFDFSIDAQKNFSEGHVPAQDTSAYDFDVTTVTAALAYHPYKRTMVAFRSSYDLRDFNARYFYTRSTFDKSRETVSRQFNHLKVRHDISQKSKMTLLATYQRTKDDFLFNPAFSGNLHTTKHFDLNLFNQVRLNAKLKLTFGTQFLRKSIDSNDRGQHESNHFGMYALGFYRPLQILSLNAGFRMEHDPIFDWEPAPHFSLSLHPTTDLTSSLSASRSIRAADFTERYISRNLPSLSPGRNIGNPNLTAETAWSYEWSNRWKPKDKWDMTANLVYRKSSNLIDYVLTSSDEILADNLEAGQDYFFPKNIGSLDTYGYELGMAKHVPATFKAVNLGLNLGYSQWWTNNEEELASKYLANHAKRIFTFGANMYAGPVFLGFSGMTKVRDAEDAAAINKELETSYTIVNLAFGASIPKLRTSLNLTAQNVFDRRHSDILGAELPGRWLFVNISSYFFNRPREKTR